MHVLQIEHKVPNYDGWKKAFESDLIDRKKSGVVRYRIYRPIDPHYIIIELEFEYLKDAEDTLSALRRIWGQVEGSIMMNAQTRILELVETKDL